MDWNSLLKHAYRPIKFDSIKVNFDVKEFIKDSGLYDFLNKKDKIYYINDSSLDFAVSLDPKIFLEFVIYVIQNVPQHHYFFDEKAKWCLVITSEGYIDFGVRN
ncbi:type IV secretion protein Rhs [Candidatus Pantoea soli]|uniref:Type IV secretion protein Rhs n=1 Tax=Candidatus Pantoea soli TaxID=3098669 RepID=A0A518XHA8_9GAMM|nr:type IV secretion protein Rhs [Pantoea soli]